MKKLNNNKKFYTSPTLNKVGNISELTLAAMNPAACDGLGCVGSGNNPNRCVDGEPPCPS